MQYRNHRPLFLPPRMGAKVRMGVRTRAANTGDGSELDSVKQRSVDALGHDPHLNPPPLKGEDIPPARKGNGEA